MSFGIPKLAQWVFIDTVAAKIDSLETLAEKIEKHACEYSSSTSVAVVDDLLKAATENFVLASHFQNLLHSIRGALRFVDNSDDLIDVSSSLEKLYNDVFAAVALARAKMEGFV